MAMEEKWDSTHKELPNDFFTWDESRLGTTEKFKNGDDGYRAIPLSEDNNMDVKKLHKSHIKYAEDRQRTVSGSYGWT